MQEHSGWRRYATLLFIVLAIGGLFWYGLANQPVDWNETFEKDRKDPYNNYIITQLLAEYHPDSPFKNVAFLGSEPLPTGMAKDIGQQTYIFLGERLSLSPAKADSLMSFAARGHTVFIASRYFPFHLSPVVAKNDEERLFEYEQENYFRIQAHFTNPAYDKAEGFTFDYVQNFESEAYLWSYAEDHLLPEATGATKLAFHHNQNMHYFSVPYGEGKFLFHTIPLLFTNYYLRNEEGFAYAKGVFSHIPNGGIYLEELKDEPRLANESGNRKSLSDGPFGYILSQTPLKWAWYTILFGSLCFLLFRAKRRQKAIGIVPEKKNTSLEYIQTVGRLYFLKPDHRKMADLKMKLFFHRLKSKSGVAIGLPFAHHELEEAFAGSSPELQQAVLEVAQAYEQVFENKQAVGADLLALDKRISFCKSLL